MEGSGGTEQRKEGVGRAGESETKKEIEILSWSSNLQRYSHSVKASQRKLLLWNSDLNSEQGVSMNIRETDSRHGNPSG